MRRFLRWCRRIFARWHKVILVVGGIFFVGGSYAAWRMHDYVENDPNFCTSCHLMESAFSRWKISPHNEVNCHTCHPGDIKANLHQLWLTLTRDMTEVEQHAVVPAKICGQCHLADDERWKLVGRTAGHDVHFNQQKIECVTCHAPAVHEFVPTDEMCQKCHGNIMVGLDAMARNHCTNCHNFLANVEEGILPSGESCGRCHAANLELAPSVDAEWHRSLQCRDCHPVHDKPGEAQPQPDRAGAAVPCDACHSDHQTPEHRDRCTGCHVPHAPQVPEVRCRDCHETQAAAIPHGGNHTCTDCHQVHERWVTPIEACGDCHSSEQALRARTRQAAHENCAVCHDPHTDRAPDLRECNRCHAGIGAEVARSQPPAHHECRSCHQVHLPERPKTCPDCHKDVAAQASASVKEHRDCTGCHKQHGPPGATLASCDRCHAKVVASERRGPPEHGDCRNCHQTHAPQSAPPPACAKCHEKQAARIADEPAKHQDCRGCHPWHQGATTLKGAPCQSCHEEQKKTDRVRPKGHASCAECHVPHDVTPPKQCADCHEEQVAKVASVRTPEHRDCKSCHGEIHGAATAKPADCRKCHEPVVATGLHTVPEHEACKDCHQMHGPAAPASNACVRCHPADEIRNHPPEARGVTRCQGCHNFTAGQEENRR